MPFPAATVMVPELPIPPLNCPTLSTAIPVRVPEDEMLPLLVMPPENVLTPKATMPVPAAEIVPLLVIPPENVALPTSMLASCAVMVPVLRMPPVNVDELFFE
jgi:hypothetical protein